MVLAGVDPGVLGDGLSEPSSLCGTELDLSPLVHVHEPRSRPALPPGALPPQQTGAVVSFQKSEGGCFGVVVRPEISIVLAPDFDPAGGVVQEINPNGESQPVHAA